SGRAAAGDDGDGVAVRSRLEHAVADKLSDVHVAGGIDGDSEWRAELGAGGEGADSAIAVNLAHLVVERIGDVDVAGGIDRYTLRSVELRAGRRAAVTPAAGAAVAGEVGDHSVRAHTADHVVGGVGDIKVPGAIDRNALRRVE